MRIVGVPYVGNMFKKVKTLKERHKGERCFIIGAGPSLTMNDLHLLKNEYTFCVNRTFKMYENSEWKPTHYVIVDHNVFIESDYDIDIKKGFSIDSYCVQEPIISDNVEKNGKINSDKKIIIPLNLLNHYMYANGFWFKYRKDLFHGVYNGGSVVNTTIDIAIYMGFTEIYLVGVDCNYSLSQSYFNSETNPLIKKDTRLETTFVLNDMQLKGFEFKSRKLKNSNVKVFNATRGGKLECFQRVCLDNLLKTPKKAGL